MVVLRSFGKKTCRFEACTGFGGTDATGRMQIRDGTIKANVERLQMVELLIREIAFGDLTRRSGYRLRRFEV
jgi:hypothetical protein